MLRSFYKNQSCLQSVLSTIGLTLAVASLACAQQSVPLEGKTAEEVYKNIIALKGIRADLVIPAMNVMNASLGVDCAYCHNAPDYAGDQKDEKRAARRMIAVSLAVNDGTVVAVDPKTGHLVSLFQKYPLGGQRLVTCFTCHHGGINPVGPPGPDPDADPADIDESRGEPAPPELPAHADQLFEKFLEAVGGVPALRKIATCHITATQKAPGSAPQHIELYEKALNTSSNTLVMTARTPTETVFSGLDGRARWRRMGPPAANQSSGELEQLIRGADVFAGLYMKQKYSLLMMVGEENIGGHHTDRVDGFLPNGNPDHLYFDTDSGLLRRIVTVSTTARGDATTTTDFDDYRGVEGIKYPFTLRITNSDQKLPTEVHIEKVELNVPVDENKFIRTAPAASSKPAER